MSNLFPFNQPGPTAFYLTLYVTTLLLHFIFMSYVFAGTSWITIGMFLKRGEEESRLVAVLKDWMPVMLSGAITAGVAPLLFLQILYRREFYTANLLLFHRWMLILPVLVALFYLLYIVKSKSLAQRFRWLPKTASLCALCCVVFVGWSWVENHQLSLAGQSEWTEMYAAGKMTWSSAAVWPRLTLWYTTTFSAMCLVLCWQLHWTSRAEGHSATRASIGAHRTAAIAIAGLAASAAMAFVVFRQLPIDVQETLRTIGFSWMIMLGIGTGVQIAGWLYQYRQGRFSGRSLTLVSAGIVLHLTGLLMLREITRFTQLQDTIDLSGHASAAKTGGLTLFVVFALINIAIIVWCVRLVKNGRRSDTSETEHCLTTGYRHAIIS